MYGNGYSQKRAPDPTSWLLSTTATGFVGPLTSAGAPPRCASVPSLPANKRVGLLQQASAGCCASDPSRLGRQRLGRSPHPAHCILTTRAAVAASQANPGARSNVPRRVHPQRVGTPTAATAPTRCDGGIPTRRRRPTRRCTSGTALGWPC